VRENAGAYPVQCEKADCCRYVFVATNITGCNSWDSLRFTQLIAEEQDVSIEENKSCVCSCDTCKDMCNRPCWPSPSEAKALIEAGYGNKLMDDHWVGSPQDNPPAEDYSQVNILGPACQGYEGKRAPFWPEGVCTFQDPNTKLCIIHDKGLKPIEGRLADCGSNGGETPPDLHREVAKLWDNPNAQKLVRDWNSMSQKGTYPKLPDPDILRINDTVEVRRTSGKWTKGTIHEIQPKWDGFPQFYVVKVALEADHYIRSYKPLEEWGYKPNIPAEDILEVS